MPNTWKSDWQNNGTSPKRYTFDYDWGNRLETANYADGNDFTSNSGAFNTQYTYDKNGNLKTLKRYKAGDFIDDLVYTYLTGPTGPTGSNQVQSVSDNGTTGVKDLGYKSGAQNYSYDGNGNMKEVHNGVDFGYNFLNLPQTMVYNLYNTIGYTYSSTGVKLQKKVVSGTTGNKVVDYIVPFLYEDSDLKVIFTSAGRIVKNVDGGTVLWKYEYNLTDHLGNVRVVFAAHSIGIPELMQHTDYYPFGMVMNQQETFNLEEVKNRYLYNGKELQDDNIGVKLDWYDYGARFYDPMLGRFHTVDPLADDYSFHSPYLYGYNNPVRFIDFMGMNGQEPEEEKKANIKRTYEDLNTLEKIVYMLLSGLNDYGKALNNQTGNSDASFEQNIKTGVEDLAQKTLLLHGHAVMVRSSTSGISGADDVLSNIADDIDDVGGVAKSVNSAKLAKTWQGNETYTGVDNWRNITLKDGKYVVGGLPEQSNYYTTMSGLNRSGLNRNNLFQGLQVSKHPQHGYRRQVGIYRINGNTPAAFGTTYANPQFGSGGLSQIYIPDYTNLQLIKTIPLR